MMIQSGLYLTFDHSYSTLSLLFLCNQSIDMATGEILKSLFFLIQAAAAVTAAADTVVNCGISLCGGDGGLSALIEFPFRLKSVQRRRCGYPGFDLTCNNQSQTILNIPGSGDFSVEFIDYEGQRIWLNDPDHCLPKRLLNFTLSGSHFRPLITRNFTLLNCSGDGMADVMATYTPGLMTVPCMSGANHTVVSVPSRLCCGGGLRACKVVGAISVPVLWPYMADLDEAIQLTWDAPKCGECVARGGHCGYVTDNGSESEIGCSISLPRQGLSKGAKYGIILGAGVPGLVCLLGLACFACGRVRNYGRRRLPTVDFSTVTGTLPVLLSVGLDGPTIESYPKTLLGESKRLPKPTDSTCSICLCEYQPEETLRTIPDCNHYFHVECIDEWLRLNGTCPLCRNSPEGSSRATSLSLSIDSSTASTSSV